jgi:DNA-binding SARP family transcriptional activator
MMKQELTFDWHKACRLLESQQYEQVAEFLQEAQIFYEHANDTIMRNILVAAHRICLACSRCHEEKWWLKQAREEADREEQALRQELHDIFNLLSSGETSEAWTRRAALPALPTAEPASAARDDPKAGKDLGLLGRIKRLLTWRLSPFLSPKQRDARRRDEAPTVPAATNGVRQPLSPLPSPNVQKPGLPALAVYCLGPFRAYVNEALIEKWPGHKCKSIFKYMLIHREAPIHQEILMDLFWPEANPETARRNLYQAIYKLRQALQTSEADVSYILCEDNCYFLNTDIELWVDSEAFTSYYQTGQRLQSEDHWPAAINEYERAESLYEGEFLAEDLYEDWPVVHRQNLKHAHLDILDRLTRSYFEQGQWAMCITYCQKILAEDNCREDAHRRLMRCYLHQGQPHLALRQYHLCAETLERELDVPPMPATVELYHQIQVNRNQF